jgi:Fic family protein
MKLPFQILSDQLLPKFLQQVGNEVSVAFNSLKEAELSTDTFSFYTSVAAVFSSKIERENIELDSYIKHKRFGVGFTPDYTKKTDDLYSAYSFAKENSLTEKNLLAAHQLLAKNLLSIKDLGKYRIQNMFITTADGKIEYVAVEPQLVKSEIQKLYHDIELLLIKELSTEEVFYYAAYIHFVFVKIHPFSDGNGRSVRLLEKWFISEKLGTKAWFLQSEKHYFNAHQTYYGNLRILGLEYVDLDYSKALPFLLMAVQGLLNSEDK